jgi:hydrogenase maturation protein HypF
MQPHLSDSKIRRQLHVRGIVQGVGFRPFVHKLATSLGLTGFVFNSSSGVTIEIEGDDRVIHTFVESLERDTPLLAEIIELTVSEMAPIGSAGFDILESREELGEFALVPPDAGTCEACWRDFVARRRRTVRLPTRIRSRPSAWRGSTCEKARSSPLKV